MAALPSSDDGCWDAFGSEDDKEELSSPSEEGVLWLMQHFLRWNHSIERRVFCSDSKWTAELQARGIKVLDSSAELCDAAIVVVVPHEEVFKKVRRNVVPNGVLMTVGGEHNNNDAFDHRVWSEKQTVYENVTARIKHPCPINEESCPWLPSSHSVSEERQLLAEATVTRSAMELFTTKNTPLSEKDLHRASTCLTKHGYCVIRNLVDPAKCLEWGTAVLQDLNQASRILKERDDVEIKSPGVNTTNYRELAMREDLRMDLRDGPHLRALREQERQQYSEWGMDETANPFAPIITTFSGSYDSCLRFYPDVLEIVKRTMNPKNDELYSGNFGRFNFDGSGPDGSQQPLRIGPMGGIVSLPGSGDQALHADTPHLFEHTDCLPAHYINAFCLGSDVGMEKDVDGCDTGSTPAGGTAFIHNSHRLSFTAQVEELSLVGNEQMLHHLVRPSLQLGDVVLFDCRVLHFGLANNSKDGIERALLYTNMTHAWFLDPKNWNDRQRIFDNLD